MDLGAQSGIVVDSSFSSRRELIRDLKNSKLVEDIYEAKSVADAIQRISSHNSDACFIGPTVSAATAIDFIKTAKKLPVQPACALIAVLKRDQSHSSELIAAGADGMLQQPYSAETFTAITLKAIRHARSLTSQELAVEQHFPYLQILADTLHKNSSLIHSVSKTTRENILKIEQQAYGDIFSSIIKVLRDTSDSASYAKADVQFARAITEWFFDVARTSESDATEKLRKKLVVNTF